MNRSIYLSVWQLVFFLCLFNSYEVSAHGERAQQPGLRMRTIQFFDFEIYPTDVKINDIVTVKGKFIPSEYWPDHMASSKDIAFLNIGVPGPAFVRLESRVNGVPMIRSTSFMEGELYEYEIKLKARKVGEYHVHPVVSVKDAGPIIGGGLWVTVEKGDVPFENHITTLFGEDIDLETVGLDNIIFWSVLWIVIGLAWFGYWLLKCPMIMSRYITVRDLGEKADEIITRKDQIAGVVFLSLTFSVIAYGYMWAEDKYPVTTPLQTGLVDVPLLDWKKNAVDIKLVEAKYRIPGRSFRVELEVTNTLDTNVRLAEFVTANLRFGNPKVRRLKPRDKHDLIAVTGLVVEDDLLLPGKSRKLVFEANDALWETYRLTSLIFDPDSRFAGVLFFEDDEGQRYPVEIGGSMLPVFIE
ncbi:MAG: hypothetical protein JKY67_04980 [Pseudomonadales bacterium]|nr:hypothetical protein [Pseudomonadales bacterium]